MCKRSRQKEEADPPCQSLAVSTPKAEPLEGRTGAGAAPGPSPRRLPREDGPTPAHSAAPSPAAAKGRTNPSHQPSWQRCRPRRSPGKQRQEKVGKQLLGPVFFPLEEPRPAPHGLARSQGSKEAVRSIRRRRMSRGYSEASGAGEVGRTVGEEELPGWLGPASSSQGLTAPSWAKAPSS